MPTVADRCRPLPTVNDYQALYEEMPKFAISHEGWVHVRIGKLNKSEKLYCSLKQDSNGWGSRVDSNG